VGAGLLTSSRSGILVFSTSSRKIMKTATFIMKVLRPSSIVPLHSWCPFPLSERSSTQPFLSCPLVSFEIIICATAPSWSRASELLRPAPSPRCVYLRTCARFTRFAWRTRGRHRSSSLRCGTGVHCFARFCK